MIYKKKKKKKKKRERNQQFTHNCREKSWIRTFPKGIIAMWTAKIPSGFELR